MRSWRLGHALAALRGRSFPPSRHLTRAVGAHGGLVGESPAPAHTRRRPAAARSRPARHPGSRSRGCPVGSIMSLRLGCVRFAHAAHLSLLARSVVQTSDPCTCLASLYLTFSGKPSGLRVNQSVRAARVRRSGRRVRDRRVRDTRRRTGGRPPCKAGRSGHA